MPSYSGFKSKAPKNGNIASQNSCLKLPGKQGYLMGPNPTQTSASFNYNQNR